ncbi:hypothetical protein ACOME3_003036, partial [Neoechinorhynchus agilis]
HKRQLKPSNGQGPVSSLCRPRNQAKMAYCCTFPNCQRSFKRASRLRDHLNSHYGTSAYNCTICSKAFTRKDTLDVHLKTVHEGIRPFACPMCEYKASQGSLLRNHIKSIHGFSASITPRQKPNSQQVYGQNPLNHQWQDVACSDPLPSIYCQYPTMVDANSQEQWTHTTKL